MFNPKFQDFSGIEVEGKPIAMGSSVIGIRYDQGVLVAADTAVFEASVARYQDVDRVFRINKQIIMGGGGNFHDVQMYRRTIERQVMSDRIYQDGFEMKPKALALWLVNATRARRLAMDPTNVELIVAGMQPNEGPYLATIDCAASISDDYVAATGPARQTLLQLVRAKKPKERHFTEKEALGLIRQSMEKLQLQGQDFRYTVGVCNAKECHIKGPYNANEDWTLASPKRGVQRLTNTVKSTYKK